MNAHDLQLLVSMIEDEYESNHHTSLSATIDTLRKQMRDEQPINGDLFRHLRNKGYNSSGRIARVVSKRLFDAASRSDKSIVEIIDSVADEYGCQPRAISDDILCRML